MKTLSLRNDIIVTRTVENQTVIITIPAGDHQNVILGVKASLAFDFSNTIIKSENRAEKAAKAYNNITNTAEIVFQKSVEQIDILLAKLESATDSLKSEMEPSLRKMKSDAENILDSEYVRAEESVRVALGFEIGSSLTKQAIQILLDSGFIREKQWALEAQKSKAREKARLEKIKSENEKKIARQSAIEKLFFSNVENAKELLFEELNPEEPKTQKQN